MLMFGRVCKCCRGAFVSVSAVSLCVYLCVSSVICVGAVNAGELVCEPQHVSSGVNKSAKKITFWPHGREKFSARG